MFVDVDMTKCGFAKIPNVVTSVEGSSSHWKILGTSSVYDTTTTGFRVYLSSDHFNLKESQLDDKLWNIDWVAVGFTC